MLTRTLTIFTGISLLLTTYFIYRSSPMPPVNQMPKSSLPTGAALNTILALEKTEYEPVITASYNELKKRNYDYHRLHWWSKAMGYIGLVLTSLLTVVAGFYGIHNDSSGDKLQQLLNEQKQSKGLMRIVGVLIALTTLPTSISNRLDTDAAAVASSGRELWQAIDAAEQKIVDPNATEGEARRYLQKVKEATTRTW